MHARPRYGTPAALALALSLTACGGDGPRPSPEPAPARAGATAAPATTAPGPEAPSTPPAVAPTAPAPTAAAPDDPVTSPAGFVAVVRAQLPEVAAGRTDDELHAVARQACVDLAAGTPADGVVATVQTLGTLDAEATDAGTARELVKLAIDTDCLDQAARVDEF